jgi:hypothetical protein
MIIFINMEITKEDSIELDKELKEKIKKFILGEGIDLNSLNLALQSFFESARFEQTDLLNPVNMTLFITTQKILENFKDTEIEKANLDYIYSYKNKPLKYCWKNTTFNLGKEPEKLKKSIVKIFKKSDFSMKNEKEMNNHVDKIISRLNDKSCDEYLSKEFGIIDKKKNTFLYVDAIDYEEHKCGEIPKIDVLLVTTKKNKKLLDVFLNNRGKVYDGLVFLDSGF